VTIGNPFGLATDGEMALSAGVVSATARSLPKLASKEDRLYSDLIQTTAQINPGNSGGPLIDVNGDVIGIDTAVILPQKQTNGIGFAIPITRSLLEEVKQLEEGREIVYGYVGVTVEMPTQQQREEAGVSEAVGVCVETIEVGSPAARGDVLRSGDIIVKVNGEAVVDSDRFVRLVGAAAVGKPAVLNIFRDGKPLVARVTPTKRPVQYVVTNQNQRLYWRGMELGPVPTNWPAAKQPNGLVGILVIGIEDDSPMKKQGLCAGTVITGIAGRPVATMTQLQKLLNDLPAEQCTVQTAGSTTEAVSETR
jgi:serine protease Do